MKPARQPPHPPQETTPATPRTPSEVDIKTLLDIHNLQNPGTPLAITDILNLPGLARLQGGTNMKPPLKGVGGDDHDHDEMADYIDDDNDEDDDNEDEDDDEAWDDIHEAARARRARHLVDAAEALRLSKLAYDPSRPGADTRADADGVALGVVPNHEARRWRERRMRLARYIQFLAGGPDVENNNNNNIIVGGGGGGGDGADDDVPPAVARFLDLGFERPGVPVAAPVVRGGRARTCMGWYVKGGRPAPDGVELRRRRRGPVVGGGGGVGLPSDEDLRALDALYEGIGTPPPLKGQGGRGQQKKGVVKAAPPIPPIRQPYGPPQPPPQNQQQQQPQAQPRPKPQAQAQAQQQPLSDKAKGKLPAVGSNSPGNQGPRDPFGVFSNPTTRLGGQKRGRRPVSLDFVPRRSPRRPAAFRGFEAGGPSGTPAGVSKRARAF